MKQPTEAGRTVSLSSEFVAQLEQLRGAIGKDSIDEVVHDAVAAYLRRRVAAPAALERLTPRLRQVLELIAGGRTTRQIAQTLGISVKTADWHRSQLTKTLGLRGVVDVVRFAIRCGIIEA